LLSPPTADISIFSLHDALPICVDLRRRQIRVAEHLLERAQVASARQQVRRERVAQRVRAHPPLQARAPRVALDDLVDALARQRRSEEHTSELQSLAYLVCRLLL